MQQFTVPQFIDVENKIIGPITTRQFLILLAAAIICAVAYKLFDFSLFLTTLIIVLALAIVLAFVRINGRPFHFLLLHLLQTWRRPHLRVWNNKKIMAAGVGKGAFVKPEAKPAPKELYKKSRLAELALIVDTKGRYKGE